MSEAPQTNIDLTLSRKAQEPLINANDGGKESLPLPPGETDDGEEEKNSTGEGVTRPDSQAAPPTPPTNNDDNKHVLIVEDPPQ